MDGKAIKSIYLSIRYRLMHLSASFPVCQICFGRDKPVSAIFFLMTFLNKMSINLMKVRHCKLSSSYVYKFEYISRQL